MSGPTISGDGLKFNCRECGAEMVKSPTGYDCPKCGKGKIVMTGGAKIVIK